MHSVSTVAALAAALTPALAAYQGFNYGSTYTDGTAKTQSNFEDEFTAAASLDGTNGGFTSARLYTMIQGSTTSDVISAIPAAISTKTSLLLGIWASGDTFDNELTALKAAISTYGSELASLVAGISVGSEDLYRNSPTGIEADAGVGAEPSTLVSYIKSVRSAISGTVLADVAVGHVDTWTAWVNSSNDDVISNCDWLGVDAYPFFQNTMSNGIDNGKALFDDALAETEAAASGKDIWITETGWPVSGDAENEAVASTANAKTYWDKVGCPMFGSTNVWWYTLQDAAPTTPNPSFGVVGSTLSSTPLYDLSCNSTNSSSTSSSATSSATGTASSSGKSTKTAASATASSTGSSGSSSSGSSSSGSSSSGSSSSGSSSSGSSSGSSGSSGSSSSGSKTGSSSGSFSTGYSMGNGTSTATGTAAVGTSTGTSSSGSSSSGSSSGSSSSGSSGSSGSSSSSSSSSSSTPSTVISGASTLTGSAVTALVAVMAAFFAL